MTGMSYGSTIHIKPTNIKPIPIPFFVCDKTGNVHITSIEARSRNHCYRGKVISITCSDCLFVALVIQHKNACALFYFEKIHPAVTELLHVDGRTDVRMDRQIGRQDEANSRCRGFANAAKNVLC